MSERAVALAVASLTMSIGAAPTWARAPVRSASATASPSAYVLPRTSWGDPDLQGLRQLPLCRHVVASIQLEGENNR
jgi:hypothetical protein